MKINPYIWLPVTNQIKSQTIQYEKNPFTFKPSGGFNDARNRSDL